MEQFMEQFPESVRIQMHVTQILSVFQKGGDRFFSFQEIAEQVKQAEWANVDYINPALKRMIDHGQLEYDPDYGYCEKGRKAAIQYDMSRPKMSRADFDNLTPAEQMEYVQNGGHVRN